MATPEGSFVSGRDAIREQWSGFVALGGNIQMTTRYVVVVGETALLTTPGTSPAPVWSCRPAPREVARRQPDGIWKYVIDHPYAAADLPGE